MFYQSRRCLRHRLSGWAARHLFQSSPHADADGIAEDADLPVIYTVYYPISPRGARGRMGRCVREREAGCYRQEHETFAVAPVFLKLDGVQIRRVAAPAGFQIHIAARDAGR